MGRSGIGIYGFDPEEKDHNLKPILKLKARIFEIKKIKKGEEIGYSYTFKAPKDMIVGVLALGYSTGLRRELSNKGFVKFGNKFLPIVGRVSMGMASVDLTGVKAKVGDEVLVYSDNPKDRNSVSNVANMCSTIPYEILAKISASIPRYIL